MAWDWKIVPSVAGGLNLAGHPAAIDDSQWTYCDGFIVQQGWAMQMPRYHTTTPSWGIGYGPMGVVPNPFDPAKSMLAVSSNGAGTAAGIKLYKVDPASGALSTQITWSGADSSGGAQDVDTGFATPGGSLVTSAFLNGYLVLCMGSPSAGTYSLLRWSGTGSYTSIKDAGIVGLRGELVTAFGSHLVLVGTARTAAGGRTLRISEVNSTDTWLPAISNSADSVVIDEATSGINGALRVANNALMLTTRSGAYQLSPTGGIPPFALNFAGGPGMMDPDFAGVGLGYAAYWQYGCETPYGPLYLGPDNVYLGETPVGTAVYSLLSARMGVGRPWAWHPGYGAALVPITQATTPGVLAYSPTTQSWSYIDGVDATGGQAVSVTKDGSGKSYWAHLTVTQDGYFQYQNAPSGLSYHVDAKIDTKDFSFGAPPMDAYVAEIRVEWESFAGRVNVYSWARNELNYGPSYATTDGLATPTWTYEGLLLDGSPSLPVRLRGKYFRFRFQDDTGNGVRIRGLAIRYQPATDRSYPR